jgi:tetratricopeptide (TPR) repeat protein
VKPIPQTNEKPRIVLNAARSAVGAGDYGKALEHYEWFFDHALDDDPGSFYGVRLSYCLNEWSNLGRSYPPALERLLWKRDESLRLLAATRDPERFHDFKSICEALQEESPLPLEKFTELHSADRELASSVRRFIWHEVVDAGLWDIAAHYIGDYREDYEQALTKFDQAMRICEENPELGGKEFAEQIEGWCIQELRDLWLVLNSTGRSGDAHDLRQAATVDVRLKGHPTVVETAFAG